MKSIKAGIIRCYCNWSFPKNDESEGNHTWNAWRLHLTELVPKFFKGAIYFDHVKK